MNFYKCLKTQEYKNNRFKIIPIRSEDKYDILKWRNEQIYHLRQQNLLSKTEQDSYFENVIHKLFDNLKPNQILFSYLEDNICIGYGGLVHINWIDLNAEISFIIDTRLEKVGFKKHWTIFLSLIEQVAFWELKLHKLYVYAFDLRPHLYSTLEHSGFMNDAILKEHCYIEGKFVDVVIHSKLNFK